LAGQVCYIVYVNVCILTDTSLQKREASGKLTCYDKKMILIKCARDARKLSKTIRKFIDAPHDVLKDISESIQAGMSEGIYIPEHGESIKELKVFLTSRGFLVSEIEYENAPALQITW